MKKKQKKKHDKSKINPLNIKDKEGSSHLAIKPGQESVIHSKRAMNYSGPLPPPIFLEGYEKVLPGCADRIVKMAENQAIHRQEHENKALSAYSSEIKRGQHLVFFLSLTSIIIGGALAAFINIYAGGVFGLLGVVFLVSQVLGKFINYLNKNK